MYALCFWINQLCSKNVYLHLLEGLFAERTAEVVVQTPLHAVFTEGVTTGRSYWLEKQPFVDKEKTGT